VKRFRYDYDTHVAYVCSRLYILTTFGVRTVVVRLR